MPTNLTRNVSLTADSNAFIRAQVGTGYDQNVSEIVRAAVRLLVQKHSSKGAISPADRSHVRRR